MTDTLDTPTDVDHYAAEELASSLEALAALIRERPAIATEIVGDVSLSMVGMTAADFAGLVALIGDGVKGDNDAEQLTFTRRFGRHVEIYAIAPKRATCERVQTGTTTVERAIYPEGVTPKIVTETVPVFEWKCPTSFLALGGGE